MNNRKAVFVVLQIHVDDQSTEIKFKGNLVEVAADLQRVIFQIALGYSESKRNIFLHMMAESLADPELLEIIQQGVDMEHIYIDYSQIEESERLTDEFFDTLK